ncbi:copper chaperone CopZ [Heyndrickxia sporothermodurans]|uniref:Copper chaperone CopZ n=1 Tax=Heyndrickxia sporothermodurans TaxID=46224 RepID=A0AB37HFJ9_9BACI|nr:copper chaperone CopZ [Heyndrickxia sporothermodurans]MBL5767475.1 copper chaperone CopZ [Heyndrickxia sporothermodurans]MBL5770911.1 copper chaperone CopZ [Heyndrickxia sporothermodurans]MBL5774586.1 copper chaperone CopZ [Heyndrickxia sporothermodurans]MBL5778096.1 copper chaperone CopZ [Heyndrickxia sporothermodurans]MBL5782899.1 copper chaperone CopZ [Heyndrickxia sporothermodurans]
MEKTTLRVNGMSCNHCVNSIEGSVGKLQGVKTVKVHLDAGTVDVEFNPSDVSLNEIKETIDDQGYDVE